MKNRKLRLYPPKNLTEICTDTKAYILISDSEVACIKAEGIERWGWKLAGWSYPDQTGRESCKLEYALLQPKFSDFAIAWVDAE